ncbi:DUF6668 family protein [Virgisporangium aliadipatigenens]|uniref:DUF6668 family protein n=1 Tax=Virgisporangium aliadipatigenens TaxID=741659 RepID=UPI00194496FF|nr:DUF6668 family protein [Virgisporangium aliadipatigenens]
MSAAPVWPEPPEEEISREWSSGDLRTLGGQEPQLEDRAPGGIATIERLEKQPPVRQPPTVPPPEAKPRPETGGRLSTRGVAWVGVHGGAGVSTLASVIGGTDLGCRWPDPEAGEPARVLLVARTNSSGVWASSRALNAIREGRHPVGMEVVSLVLVADAPGRLPMRLARRIRVLRSAVPIHRIPWIPEWRLGSEAKRTPRELHRLAALADVERN